MGWGSVAPDRVRVRDLPSTIEAKVEPNGQSDKGQDRYSWRFDQYGIVRVAVYLPSGETLPAGGVTLKVEDFDTARGRHASRKGEKTGFYSDSTVGPKGESLRIWVDAPENFDHFEAIHIEHA